MINKTHTISLNEAYNLYNNNFEFRNIIQSGCFIYIEDSYIFDVPQYISRNEGETTKLTKCARENLNKCALIFDEQVVFEYSGSYTHKVFGSNNADEKKRSKIFKSSSQKSDLPKEIKMQRELAQKQFENQQLYFKTCWEKIYEILQSKHETPETFSEKTLLNENFYYKAKNNNKTVPKMHTIVSIAAGYNLGLQLTEYLLKLAGHTFIPTSKNHDAYRFILSSMSGYDINQKNLILIKEGFEPLGSKSSEPSD